MRNRVFVPLSVFHFKFSKLLVVVLAFFTSSFFFVLRLVPGSAFLSILHSLGTWSTHYKKEGGGVGWEKEKEKERLVLMIIKYSF